MVDKATRPTQMRIFLRQLMLETPGCERLPPGCAYVDDSAFDGYAEITWPEYSLNPVCMLHVQQVCNDDEVCVRVLGKGGHVVFTKTERYAEMTAKFFNEAMTAITSCLAHVLLPPAVTKFQEQVCAALNSWHTDEVRRLFAETPGAERLPPVANFDHTTDLTNDDMDSPCTFVYWLAPRAVKIIITPRTQPGFATVYLATGSGDEVVVMDEELCRLPQDNQRIMDALLSCLDSSPPV